MDKLKSEKTKRLLKFKERQEARARKAFYKQTPLKPIRRNKLRKGDPYCERYQTTRASYKVICYECHEIYVWPDYFALSNSSEMRKCKCGSTNVRWIGPIARLPRKNANKKKWDEFWKHCGKNCAGACR